MKKIFLIVLVVTLNACTKNGGKKLKMGNYRGLIEVQDNEQLPFIFAVESSTKLKVYNAQEVIEVDEIIYKKDSVYIKMPVFEGFLAAKIHADNSLSGFFIKKSEDRVTTFNAVYNEDIRFKTLNNKPNHNISGIWETVFSKNIREDEYIAKGIFNQEGTAVTGTFRTTTGDYRYLEGVVDGDSLKLSTFDGAHAFLFQAKITDSTMNGVFYSGNHWKEPFEAKRNKNYELPNANELTFLNDGYDKFAFSFPDVSGKMISLEDERFKNKVVVVQIMGTWCPNCLDESKFYTSYQKEHNSKDLEFIALAFEYAKTEEQAFNRIKRLKDKINIAYPILLAQYGTSSKEKAQEKLPMLNHILSYPTTIFIDKKGKVRKIHTGFNGPATGEKYTEFKTEFEDFITLLLSE